MRLRELVASSEIVRIILQWLKKFRSSRIRFPTSKNNYKRMKPVLVLLKMLGVFPYGIGPKCVKSSGIFDYALALVSVCLFSIPIGVLLTTGHLPMASRIVYRPWAHLLDFVSITKNCCLYVPIFLEFFNCVFRNRLTVKYFARLARWDEAATRLGHPREQKIAKYWIFMVAYSIPLVLIFRSFVLKYQNNDVQFWKDLPIPFLMLFHSCVVLKWVILVWMICERFEHLKLKAVKNITPAATISYNGTGTLTSENIIKLHSDLVEIVAIFNRLASFSLLMTFSALVPNSLLSMKVIDYAIKNASSTPYAIASFFHLMAISLVCAQTVAASEEFGRLLNKAGPTIDDTSSEDFYEKTRRSIELTPNEFTFSGGELFNVDMNTFQGYAHFYFTYIIILSGFQ